MTTGFLARTAQRLWQPASKRIVAGQALWQTHPELLRHGELAPGLPAEEFAARRAALADALPANSVALLPAPPLKYMAGVVPYPYRPDADMVYLTGVRQPGTLAAISSAEGSGKGAFTLFVPDASQSAMQWEGPPLNTAAAEEIFGANAAFPMSQLRSRLPGFLAGAKSVLCDLGRARDSPVLVAALQAAKLDDARIRSLRPVMHRLRWRKSAAELKLMRTSAAIAASGIQLAMQRTRPGMFEFQIASTFEHHCKMTGAEGVAYTPIVASGADACTIHYSRNDKKLRAGSLIKMDAGCELHGYNSDVTRCWPVSGSFSPQQRAIYEAVLDINRECIKHIRPGTRVSELHSWSCSQVSDVLCRLGLLAWSRRSVDAHRRFYPHSLAHWLGMDVHDCGDIKMDSLELQPGVVLTIEPGIYLPDEDRYGAFAGIGVRIEDDVICGTEGPEVISAGVPTDIDAIEKLVGSDAQPLLAPV